MSTEFVIPRHMNYIKSVCLAIATGAEEIPTALSPEQSGWAWIRETENEFVRRVSVDASWMCLAAHCVYLMNHSTTPIDLEGVSRWYKLTPAMLLSQIERFDRLKLLHAVHEEKRLVRLDEQEAQRKIQAEIEQHRAEECARRAARTPADQEAELKAILDDMHGEAMATNGYYRYYYDMLRTDVTKVEMPESARNKFIVMQGLATGRFKYFAEAARVIDRSNTVASATFGKFMRLWRHPGRYGEIFRLDVDRVHFNKPVFKLELVDPNHLTPEGDTCWIRYDWLYFTEAVVIINKRLALLGHQLSLPLRYDESAD
jgi:hypothetical protein